MSQAAVALNPEFDKAVIQQRLHLIEVAHDIGVEGCLGLGPRVWVCEHIVPTDGVCFEGFAIAVAGHEGWAEKARGRVVGEAGAGLPGAWAGVSVCERRKGKWGRGGGTVVNYDGNFRVVFVGGVEGGGGRSSGGVGGSVADGV